MFSVHAEEITREYVFEDHCHDHAHENVAAFHAIREIAVHFAAIEDCVIESIDDFLVSDLRDQAADTGVAEFGEAENPLLDVLAEGLAGRLEVVFVFVGDYIVIFGVAIGSLGGGG